MKMKTLTFLLGLSLTGALPFQIQAADKHDHVDCSTQGADLSKMTPEQREKMQAQCKEQHEHANCGKSAEEMSHMTADQREKMQSQCRSMHEGKSGMHSDKDANGADESSPKSHGHAGGASS